MANLPYSQFKQDAILGHLLVDEKFFKAIYHKIQPRMFLSPRATKIYELQIIYYKKLKRFPRIAELKNSVELEPLDMKEKLIINSYISKCIISAKNIKIDIIQTELTEWLHSYILVNALKKANNAWNSQNIKDCHSIMMDAVKEVTSTSFDRGEVVDFNDFSDLQNDTSRTAALTTGLKLLDEALLSNATNGGLLLGETTTVLAPVNVGKTSFLLTVLCEQIRRGKDCLLITLEGTTSQIVNRIKSNMLNATYDELRAMCLTEEGRNKLLESSALIKKHCKFLPYNKPGGTIEDLEPIIAHLQEAEIVEKEKGFDMLVCDYPAILGTDQNKKGNLVRRDVETIVYRTFSQIAAAYNLHALLAIQTNREGSKINKKISGDRLLEIEDVRETFDVMALSHNVVTLNRSPFQKLNNMMTFNIAKSRSSVGGTAITVRTDPHRCITHSEALGGCIAGLGNSEETTLRMMEEASANKKTT